MDKIVGFIQSNILLFIVAGVVILLGIAAFIVFLILAQYNFKKRLKLVQANPELAEELIRTRYAPAALARRSNQIRVFADKNGYGILQLIGIDDIWIERLKIFRNKQHMLRVLKYLPEKGLFKAFLACLDRPNLFPLLMKWLSQSTDLLVVRRIGMAGRGEDFDGRKALRLFKDRIDEIREMAGDPEWASRYFAVKILLHDREERSLRALWEACDDPHPLIRKTLINGFFPDDRERLFNTLFVIFTDDPVYEVRKAAIQRIYRQFEDFFKLKIYNLDSTALSSEQLTHVLELLRPDVKEDENYGFKFLTSANLEVRLAAALYLEKCGSLHRLCSAVDLGDREELERNLNLLKHASEVNVVSFLTVIDHADNPATLLVCAEILKINQNRKYINRLAKRLFTIYDGNSRYDEVYAKTLDCISETGDEASFKLVVKELVQWKENEKIIKLLLSKIPLRADYIFAKTLIDFLVDKDFIAKQELLALLAQFAHYLVLPEIIAILRGDRQDYPHVVRMQAFKLLGMLRLPYCLQLILENLPILPGDQARDFMKTIVDSFPTELLVERIEKLLSLSDSKIRAAVIATLPGTGRAEFLPAIRKAFKDADPDVRIASVWAIIEYEDTKSLSSALAMLRDPLERVRIETARAIGTYGSPASLEKLKELLFDANEIEAVKLAAVEGLGRSRNLLSIEILLGYGFQDVRLKQPLITALATKVEKNQIVKLIEEFKNAEPVMREVIAAIFKGMGYAGEKLIVELLKEDIGSLKPYIADILDSTGGVESIIRRLKNRDPNVRREAAGILAYIGSKAAFRGMVQAARDPDDEVRIRVIKALEILETAEGKDILAALQSDPDDRVRKYTHWAIERLKAKEL